MRGATRCTAGGATSTNRASRPGARRRTRAAPRSTVPLSSPHDQPAAQAHRTNVDVHEPCVLPRLHGPWHRVALVVRGDVRSEEAANPLPLPAAHDIPGDRQHATRVEPPPE